MWGRSGFEIKGGLTSAGPRSTVLRATKPAQDHPWQVRKKPVAYYRQRSSVLIGLLLQFFAMQASAESDTTVRNFFDAINGNDETSKIQYLSYFNGALDATMNIGN